MHDPVEIRRSGRRRRTVSVFREQGRLVAVVPAGASQRQVDDLVPSLVQRLLRQEARRLEGSGDPALHARAESLAAAHLVGGLATPLPPFTISWVANQQRRWGSCTPDQATIRISDRVRDLPEWVGDCVILHELVHLVEPHHDDRFWALLGRYPRLERARGFLEGYEYGVRHDGAADGPDQDPLD